MEKSVFTFDLDDDDYAGGGFSDLDMSVFAELEGDAEADPKEEKSIDPDPETEEETEEPEPEPEPEPEQPKLEPPKPRDEDARYDFLMQQAARQASELAEARRKVDELSRNPTPVPTEEDWVNDPSDAARRIAAIEEEKREYAKRDQREAEIKQAQGQVWAQMTQTVPAFLTDETLRRRWASVFYLNPEYTSAPDGPLKAAQEVYKLWYAGKEEAAPPPPPPPAPEPPKIAEATEAARSSALKKGAMHGSGKGGGQAKVQGIDPKLAKMAKEWGISTDSLKRVMS